MDEALITFGPLFEPDEKLAATVQPGMKPFNHPAPGEIAFFIGHHPLHEIRVISPVTRDALK